LDGEFTRARALVEEVVKSLGIDPAVALTKQDDDTSVSWSVQRGSAPVLITLVRRPSAPNGELRAYLRVISPVLVLRDAPSHEALFRRLLQLNAAGLSNAAFGLVESRVVAVSERPTEDLQKAEVEQMIRHLAAVADTYDDRLRNEFGGDPRASSGP
jgi:hypothetical protein